MKKLILCNTDNFGKVIAKHTCPFEYRPGNAFISSPFMFPRYLMETKKDEKLLKQIGHQPLPARKAMEGLYLGAHNILLLKTKNHTTLDLSVALTKTVSLFKEARAAEGKPVAVNEIIPHRLLHEKYFVDLPKLCLLVTSIMHTASNRAVAREINMRVENDSLYLRITITPGIWSDKDSGPLVRFLESVLDGSLNYCEVSIAHDAARITMVSR